MKKTLTVMFALLTIAGAANAAPVIHDWFSIDDLARGEPGHDLESLTGKAAPATAWVGIYKATEARTTGNWHTDIIINADKTAGQGGTDDGTGDVLVHLDNCEKSGYTFFYEAVELEPGEHYFTVLWDLGESHIPGVHDEYIVLDKVTFEAKASGPDYEVFEKSKSSGITWQTIQYETVPEPSVIGMMGLAGTGLYLIRRRSLC